MSATGSSTFKTSPMATRRQCSLSLVDVSRRKPPPPERLTVVSNRALTLHRFSLISGNFEKIRAYFASW